MKLLGSYKNGNYTVKIFDDGTKIRYNDKQMLIPDTVESVDLKITNMCDMGCKMCHEDSIPNGKHGDILSPSFLDKLHPYTEIAIGGGNPLEHPDLEEFLIKCKDKKFIPSMTVNQVHFMRNKDFIKTFCDNELIYGLGISLGNVNGAFIEALKDFPNAVIHIIAGIHSSADIAALAGHHLKILILGYKTVRRGKDLYEVNHNNIDFEIDELKNFLPVLVEDKVFDCISFDNLALKQLDVKNILNINDEEWEQMYMGDDGQEEMTSASMFVDMVERKFARNSCSMDRYPLMDTIEEMYNYLRSKN